MPWLLYFVTHQQHNNSKESKKNIIIFISFKINPITFLLALPTPPRKKARNPEHILHGFCVCSRFNFDLKSNTVHNVHNQQQTRSPPFLPIATQLDAFLNEFKMCLRAKKDSNLISFAAKIYATSYEKDVEDILTQDHIMITLNIEI